MPNPIVFNPADLEEKAELSQSEKLFVQGIVQGKTPEEACVYATYSAKSAATMSAQLLARPHIRKAIKQYLPYVSDPKVGLRIAALFAYENVINSLLGGAHDKNVIAVSKDILDRAGYVAVTKSEHSSKSYSLLLKQIQQERAGQSERKVTGRRAPAPALPAYEANRALSEGPDLAPASPTPFGFGEELRDDSEGEE